MAWTALRTEVTFARANRHYTREIRGEIKKAFLFLR
jgi:hypothetical protein